MVIHIRKILIYGFEKPDDRFRIFELICSELTCNLAMRPPMGPMSTISWPKHFSSGLHFVQTRVIIRVFVQVCQSNFPRGQGVIAIDIGMGVPKAMLQFNVHPHSELVQCRTCSSQFPILADFLGFFGSKYLLLRPVHSPFLSSFKLFVGRYHDYHSPVRFW